MAQAAKRQLPTIELPDQEAWERWLQEHHRSSSGVWLRIAKAGAPRGTPSYAEALDVALCHGWIDGQKAADDASFWLQRFTPRGPRSKWSQRNRAHAERLIGEGRMKDAGLAAVNAAKADGRWEAAYEPQGSASIPEDFQRALDRNPAAKKFFATLTGVNRYSFLYRISDAKRPETRARRIEKFVDMLAEGRVFHP